MTEVLIASAIVLVLFGLVAKAFVFAGRYFSRVSEFAALEARCLTTLELLTRELTETKAHLTVCQAESLIFPSAREPGGGLNIAPGSSELLWGRVVCFQRLPAERQLIRLSESVPALPVPRDPLAYLPAKDASYFTSNGERERIIARDVELFEARHFQADGNDPDKEPDPASQAKAEFLDIRLKLLQKKTRALSIEIKLSVTPKN